MKTLVISILFAGIAISATYTKTVDGAPVVPAVEARYIYTITASDNGALEAIQGAAACVGPHLVTEGQTDSCLVTYGIGQSNGWCKTAVSGLLVNVGCSLHGADTFEAWLRRSGYTPV